MKSLSTCPDTWKLQIPHVPVLRGEGAFIMAGYHMMLRLQGSQEGSPGWDTRPPHWARLWLCPCLLSTQLCPPAW